MRLAKIEQIAHKMGYTKAVVIEKIAIVAEKGFTAVSRYELVGFYQKLSSKNKIYFQNAIKIGANDYKKFTAIIVEATKNIRKLGPHVKDVHFAEIVLKASGGRTAPLHELRKILALQDLIKKEQLLIPFLRKNREIAVALFEAGKIKKALL